MVTTVKITQNNSGMKEVLAACKELSKKVQVGYFSDPFVVFKASVNEYGSEELNVPRRPFIWHTVGTYGKQVLEWASASLNDGFTVKNAKEMIKRSGKLMKGSIQDSIDTVSTWSNYPHNSPDTIEYKGFDRPLYFTGEMRESVEIREI